MKKYLVVTVIALFNIGAIAQIPKGVNSKTQIYLVRHAEKLSGNDPLLSDNGNKRAGDLMRVLLQKNLKNIYVTQFKRTQNTADSLRIQLSIDTIHYNANQNGEDLFKKIALKNDFEKTILIIGHSNTLPFYIKKLGVKNYPIINIDDSEYDNLFKVYYKRPFVFCKRKAKVKFIKFGEKSSVSAKME